MLQKLPFTVHYNTKIHNEAHIIKHELTTNIITAKKPLISHFYFFGYQYNFVLIKLARNTYKKAFNSRCTKSQPENQKVKLGACFSTAN